MQWTPEQDRALQDVDSWLQQRDQQVYRLFGYAGTGKTTMAKALAENVQGTVLFGAYTGKAAHVLRQKGCPGASTIHSMIYTTSEKGRAKMADLEQQLAELMNELRAEGLTPEQSNEHRRVKDIRDDITLERGNLARPVFRLNSESPVKDAALVVIDECSMVDGQMADDLLYFGAKVLVLGDPAQLPPIGGGGYFTENVKPDTMLTDIQRQAADNPIIALATRVRRGERLDLGTFGSSRVIPQSEVRQELALQADQILVGRNATRRSSNLRMRSLLGLPGELPVPRDKLVCLRNDHEKGLMNGAIWHVEDNLGSRGSDRVILEISAEGADEVQIVEAHSHHFQGRGGDLPWYERKDAQEFDYGYALTVHKSQGSQWDNVLLFDESGAFRADRDRWLYTGITRAAETVTVVRMG